MIANGGSGFVPGEAPSTGSGQAGATAPAVYNLQALTLNSGSRLEIVGPVVEDTGRSVPAEPNSNEARLR